MFYYRALPQIPIDNAMELQPLTSEELATLQTIQSWKPVAVENTEPVSVATDSSVPFFDPLNPQAPALEAVNAPPLGSVNEIIVLLKLAKT